MTLREQVNDRIWYESADKKSFAFLVDAPIAFGHSQLAISIPHGIQEEDAFTLAATHIALCIGRFRSTFMNFQFREWGPLAKYTGTSGHYVKTLILKASASEKQEEYKVHLVPCFSSHIDSANDLFRARFGGKEAGGLLHWLGEREHLVDYDTLPRPLGEVAEARVKSFGLTGLAALLRCPIQSATP